MNGQKIILNPGDTVTITAPEVSGVVVDTTPGAIGVTGAPPVVTDPYPTPVVDQFGNQVPGPYPTPVVDPFGTVVPGPYLTPVVGAPGPFVVADPNAGLSEADRAAAAQAQARTDQVSAAQAAHAAGTAGTYTTQPGDTLDSIALAIYGSINPAEQLFDANSGAIGTNPLALPAGQVLVVPVPKV